MDQNVPESETWLEVVPMQRLWGSWHENKGNTTHHFLQMSTRLALRLRLRAVDVPVFPRKSEIRRFPPRGTSVWPFLLTRLSAQFVWVVGCCGRRN